jgi:hypothetical protein
VDWLKLNSKGILRGSLSTTDNTTQLIWIKLLAMANETRDRDGCLRYAIGKPYSHDYIAQVCNVTINELYIAIDDYMDDIRDGKPRVEYAEDGSLKLNNWLKYQSEAENGEGLNPRLKKAIDKDKLTRFMVNSRPETARDTLNDGFGDTIIDKNGEILRGNKENENEQDINNK